MKYLFILGRNKELSLAELHSYFGNKILNVSLYKNTVLIDLKDKLESNTIDQLGGTISIGEVLVSTRKFDDLLEQIEKIPITIQANNKLNYVLWDFSPNNVEDLEDYLKKRFKKEKYKASQKNITGKLKLSSGKIIENLPADANIDEQYFLFQDKDFYFGKITQIYDSASQEKRDMKKPVRREELAISPRLAKIMINLSQVKEKELLVDPFCGIGVILQEALLKKIRVLGIDKNDDAIKGAKQNLEWMHFDKDAYKLLIGDSRSIQIPFPSVCVTEPDLGIILKTPPTEQEAKEIIGKFEKLIVIVINNIKRNIKGKIVFTTPLIKVKNKQKSRVGCNANKILEKTGLRLSTLPEIRLPLEEYRENQIVGRQIFILER